MAPTAVLTILTLGASTALDAGRLRLTDLPGLGCVTLLGDVPTPALLVDLDAAPDAGVLLEAFATPAGCPGRAGSRWTMRGATWLIGERTVRRAGGRRDDAHQQAQARADLVLDASLRGAMYVHARVVSRLVESSRADATLAFGGGRYHRDASYSIAELDARWSPELSGRQTRRVSTRRARPSPFGDPNTLDHASNHAPQPRTHSTTRPATRSTTHSAPPLNHTATQPHGAQSGAHTAA